jgi:hypothetical protein
MRDKENGDKYMVRGLSTRILNRSSKYAWSDNSSC